MDNLWGSKTIRVCETSYAFISWWLPWFKRFLSILSTFLLLVCDCFMSSNSSGTALWQIDHRSYAISGNPHRIILCEWSYNLYYPISLACYVITWQDKSSKTVMRNQVQILYREVIFFWKDLTQKISWLY